MGKRWKNVAVLLALGVGYCLVRWAPSRLTVEVTAREMLAYI